MASIFTYEPDPPRVASPWAKAKGANGSRLSSSAPRTTGDPGFHEQLSLAEPTDHHRTVFRLQAEPQEGPVEYKLHLLLRPRRKFRYTSTSHSVSGSKHSKLSPHSNMSDHRHLSETAAQSSTATTRSATPPQASTQQTRQHRLEQLTTQLLWRLQQSSPHHTSSATNIIFPSLPDVTLTELPAPQQPAKLLHGLEESQGALYEIGVSDDGTLIGLAEDEMAESLNNLQAMAACLGCVVEVLRREIVGECEWIDSTESSPTELGRRGEREREPQRQIRRSGKLVVVEALVKPFLHPNRAGSPWRVAAAGLPLPHELQSDVSPDLPSSSPTEQLRITLTGPTMCGKSTLLGTLTTSTLDNGRGKSRLSMLKHRHEIKSGVTSSVTQELLGYHPCGGDPNDGDVEVINYATPNIASWTDIHAAAGATTSSGRLVFISDSAGHPRYRRTTLRGLVGWAPHWTLLCIPADDTTDGGLPEAAGSSSLLAASRPRSSSAAASAAVPGSTDLCQAHLELCLRLDLRLVVVITKLDLASKTGLRKTLTRALDTLKVAGRRPVIVPSKSQALSEADLQTISTAARNAAVDSLDSPSHERVPIVLTSSVDGTGIRDLHALLYGLPIADDTAAGPSPTSEIHTPRTILDIEDVYHKPSPSNSETDGPIPAVIVSGRLRHGVITVGDTLFLGPFSSAAAATTTSTITPNAGETSTSPCDDESEDGEGHAHRRSIRAEAAAAQTSRSYPGAMRHPHHHQQAESFLHVRGPSSPISHPEWLCVRVTSARNLRLPVHALHADQVGTLAVTPCERDDDDDTAAAASVLGAGDRRSDCLTRIRKGMVLAGAARPPAVARRGFTGAFPRAHLGGSIAVGSHAVVYVRSVRAACHVVSAQVPPDPDPASAVRTRNNHPPATDPNVVPGTAVGASRRRRGGDGDDSNGDDNRSPGEYDDADDDAPWVDYEHTAVAGVVTAPTLLVTFAFADAAGPEFVQPRDRVLVMPGGGPGLSAGLGLERGEKGVAGLDGFVGRIVDVL